MKALVRNRGETIKETMNVSGIDWDTGAPLTNPGWFGGPYRLVHDYIETIETEVEFEIQERGAGAEHYNDTAPAPAQEPETVTIDGKEYTKDELLAMLNQTS